VLLGHLLRGLQHGLAGGVGRVVLADRGERAEDDRLGDRVEVPALVEHEVHVSERLQAGAEPARGSTDPLCHGADLPRALCEDRDDLVGLGELHGAEDDALFLVERHLARIVR
jgi:hypothetical protein